MEIDDKVQSVINFTLTNWTETERSVEIPFLFRELPEVGAFMSVRILDVGCCESPLVMELNNLGFDSWGIDMRDYVDGYPKFIKCDARNVVRIPTSTFDVVIAISTIEHVGLVETPYLTDNTFDIKGDIKAVKEMLRIVKPGEGRVIITIPYGDGSVELKNWMRFYYKERIANIVKETGLVIDKIEYFVFRNGKWSVSDEKECARSYSAPTGISLMSPVTGNVCILGHKNDF
jgi:SAM-dependent methyltransferase